MREYIIGERDSFFQFKVNVSYHQTDSKYSSIKTTFSSWPYKQVLWERDKFGRCILVFQALS